MWNDPIVEETRRRRENYAARFGFDLDAIVRDLQDWGRRGCPVVEGSEEGASPVAPEPENRADVGAGKPEGDSLPSR